MNLPSYSGMIKSLLEKHNIRPSKGLGQNFLISEFVLNKIIETAELNKDDIVLEIGPGVGNLTKELSKKARRVLAIEKDRSMLKILSESLKPARSATDVAGEDYKNVQIIEGDALKFDPEKYNLKNKEYKIVANIPYYLTSPLIRKFLETPIGPSEMILMIQKEVAKRICSNPPDMSLLAVSVQFYADPQIMHNVPSECFFPKPKVDSAVIKIIPKDHKENNKIDTGLFFKIAKAGFSHPRKQLINNLSNSLLKDKKQIEEWLLKSKIDPKRRAETLSIDDWKNLTKSF